MRYLLVVFLVATAWAQEAPPAEGKQPPHAMPEPKNLKVLKVSGAEIMPIMFAFSKGLGVKCDHCHVQGNFASDEKPQKDFARKMIVMAQQINTNFPDGKTRVTCYTCHRGETEPKTDAPGGGMMKEEPKPKE